MSMHCIQDYRKTGFINILKLNRSVCVGFALAFAFVLQGYAELNMYTREQRILYTSAWEGERFEDGRPKVSQSILERTAPPASPTEAPSAANVTEKAKINIKV